MDLNFNAKLFLVKLLKNHIENTEHNLRIMKANISDELKDELHNEIDISNSIIDQIIASAEDSDY